jgi:hypothetical protein
VEGAVTDYACRLAGAAVIIVVSAGLLKAAEVCFVRWLSDRGWK